MAVIPSLTLDGFISNKHAQISKLFLYFLSSKYSQSNVFYGKISSLDYILANYKETIDIKKQIDNTLNKLYKNYFTEANFNTSVIDEESSGTIKVYINGTMKDNGEVFDLTRELSITHGDVESYNTMLDQYYNEYMGVNV